jgi:NitT/TauT family transport system permease protein
VKNISVWKRTEYTRTVVVVLVSLMVIWEIVVRLLHIKAFILPAPSSVFLDIYKYPEFYFQQSLYTIYVTMVGFAMAVVGGIGLAVAIISSQFLERTLYTLLVALNSIPKVALAPLFVIWLGTGGAPKIAIAALIAIFPIVINTTLGLRAVDPEMINLARSARATKRHIMMKIRFPNALPSIFAGAKVGISFALIGAIVGEFVAGENGLGYVILTSQSTFNTPRAFGAIILLGVIGTIMFFIVDVCERWLLPWHVSLRGGAEAK